MATQSYLSNPPAALFTVRGYPILPEQSPSSPIYHTWLLNPTWVIPQQPYLPYMATQSYLSNLQQPYLPYMATQAYLSNYPAALFTIHGHSILPEQSPSSPIYHTWPLNHTWAITQQPYLLYVATQSYLSNHTRPYLLYVATQYYLSNHQVALFTTTGY